MCIEKASKIVQQTWVPFFLTMGKGSVEVQASHLSICNNV